MHCRLSKHRQFLFVTEEKYNWYCENDVKKLILYHKPAREDDWIEGCNGRIVAAAAWPVTSGSRPGNFAKFLDVVRTKLGYVVETC